MDSSSQENDIQVVVSTSSRSSGGNSRKYNRSMVEFMTHGDGAELNKRNMVKDQDQLNQPAQPANIKGKNAMKAAHWRLISRPKRSREFQAVHKVLVQKDPVLGPYAEYRKVYDELKIYKSQEINQRTTASAYKSLSGLVGWNSTSSVSTNNGNNNINGQNGMVSGIVNSSNSLSYNFHDNGNAVVDQSPFSCYSSSNYGQSTHEKIRQQEKNSTTTVDSVVPIVLQQHQQQYSLGGFNQQYYLSGQFNQVNTKTIESTIWEGGS
uniref:Uncharacterized protein n=1 Tax=Cannabis sativa TaxID=3483 RepID=A0A803PL95_CANSA